MRRTIITIFVLYLALFGYSVSLKYAWPKAYYVPSSRALKLASIRPALPIIWWMNEHIPDARVFQNHFDEYRAWADFDYMGRRQWADSWNDFRCNGGGNTARNLWEWLYARDRTHFFPNPSGPWELPLDDPDFERAFWPVVSYGPYVMYQLADGGEPPELVRLELTTRGGGPAPPLQE